MDTPTLDRIVDGLLSIFYLVNGNPTTHYSGIRFLLGMFFSFMLILVIRMRVLNSMETRHFMVLVGGVFLFIRNLFMMIFLWGYDIGIYTDGIFKFLFPPVEHFLETLAYGFIACYTIKTADPINIKYKNTKWYGLAFITSFYIYATYTWKTFFFENYPNNIPKFFDHFSDWQSHLVIAIISGTALYKLASKMKLKYEWLIAFWAIVTFEHALRAIVFYIRFEPPELATFFHALHIWSIPLITMHFISGYAKKLKWCDYCNRNSSITSV